MRAAGAAAAAATDDAVRGQGMMEILKTSSLNEDQRSTLNTMGDSGQILISVVRRAAPAALRPPRRAR